MKKLITFAVIGSMLFAFAGCGSAVEEKAEAEATEAAEAIETEAKIQNVGGFQNASSHEITDEIRDITEAACKSSNLEYEPVAYIASQVVAGTNHLILAVATDSSSDTRYYCLLKIYEDLQGNSELLSSVALDESDSSFSELPSELGLAGGWAIPENNSDLSSDIGLSASTALSNAELSGLTDGISGDSGAITSDMPSYTPIAVLGTQVVAGINYMLLCENENGTLYVVTVYESLENSSEITSADTFTYSVDF